jgi:hypothetical protein
MLFLISFITLLSMPIYAINSQNGHQYGLGTQKSVAKIGSRIFNPLKLGTRKRYQRRITPINSLNRQLREQTTAHSRRRNQPNQSANSNGSTFGGPRYIGGHF